MPRRILTGTEMKNLLRVRTTVEQARTILERNRRLLTLVSKGIRSPDEGVGMGCPHCLAATDDTGCHRCGECAWNIRPFNRDVPLGGPCTMATFGGVRMEQAIGVWLSPNDAGFNARPNVKAKRFVQGHIEWAKEVIRRKRPQ